MINNIASAYTLAVQKRPKPMSIKTVYTIKQYV